MRKSITVVLLLLLVISLFNFRVVGLPTTTLTFKVLERDYNQFFKLDFEGDDDISYTYSITEDDPDGALNYDSPSTSTDYAYSGSYSLKFRVYGDISVDTVYKITLVYTFSSRLHSLFYRYIIKSFDSGGYANITIYIDGTQIKFDSVSGTSKDSDWLEIDKKNDVQGFHELKVVVETLEDINYANVVDVCKFYIDYGRRFKDVVVEKSLTVEYWSERIDVDKYRVHYTLDSSQLSGKWWVAYIEGDYYLEEGNGGRYGGLSFDGTNDYIKVPHSSSLNITDSITIEAWIMTNTQVTDARGIIDKQITDKSGYRMCVENNVVEFGIYGKSVGAGFTELNGKTQITDGKQHYLVGTWDGSNMKVYVDKELDGEETQSGMGANTQAVYLGKRDISSGFYKGVIISAGIYNRALSSDEIYNNYINEEPTNKTGLVLYLSRWSIDPYAGYWYDISGYSNHGTIYGASVSSEKALGLTICPGSSEWKFYRDYTESSYPHSHYFVIFRFDNGTLCNSTVQINFGTSEEEVSNWLWYKEKSQITQEFYTVKNGSDWYRHFRIHPSVTAYVPTPEDTYSFITFNIHDYTGSFENSSLLVYDTQSRLIQEELITSTYQAVCYLKAYGSYLIVIKKNSEERVIGWIVVSSAEKDLYIGVLPPTYTNLFRDVKYSVEDDESNTQMTITINGSSSFNYKVEIYKNGTLEFSKEGSGVTTVSITYDYDTTGFREVHITITDPSTSQSMTRIHYTGRAIEQMPTPPERIPLITQLLNNTVMNQLQQYASIGLENIIAYLLAISVFLLLATKYSLGAGMIGSGIVIIFVKAYLGSVTAFPDLMISTIIIFGGIYELTKKR